MYNLDFDKLGKHLMPGFLRQPAFLAWMRVLLFPMRYINDALQAYIAAKRLEMAYNGQTMVLAQALNDHYPAAAGGILIDNTGYYLPRTYVFYSAENQGDGGFGYFAAEAHGDYGFWYFATEYAAEYDFIVKVPVALVYDANEMKGFINTYKIAGKRYIIQTY